MWNLQKDKGGESCQKLSVSIIHNLLNILKSRGEEESDSNNKMENKQEEISTNVAH